MTLKEKIQQDFIAALKAKELDAKLALSGLKAKITEAEKIAGNQELDDSGVIKVVVAAVKQRKQSHSEYTKAGREDLAARELAEMNVLQRYLPSMMDEETLKSKIAQILSELPEMANVNARSGRAIGEFNKRYNGQADLEDVKRITTELVNQG